MSCLSSPPRSSRKRRRGSANGSSRRLAIRCCSWDCSPISEFTGKSDLNGGGDELPAVALRGVGKAMLAARDELTAAGAEFDKAFVVISARNVPPGEPPDAMVGAGFDDTADMLAFLVGQATEIGRSIGVTLVISEGSQSDHGLPPP